MTVIQRVTIWLGGALMVGLTLYPQWLLLSPNGTIARRLGHHWLFEPPNNTRAGIDIALLTTELLVCCVVVAGLVLASSRTRTGFMRYKMEGESGPEEHFFRKEHVCFVDRQEDGNRTVIDLSDGGGWQRQIVISDFDIGEELLRFIRLGRASRGIKEWWPQFTALLEEGFVRLMIAVIIIAVLLLMLFIGGALW